MSSPPSGHDQNTTSTSGVSATNRSSTSPPQKKRRITQVQSKHCPSYFQVYTYGPTDLIQYLQHPDSTAVARTSPPNLVCIHLVKCRLSTFNCSGLLRGNHEKNRLLLSGRSDDLRSCSFLVPWQYPDSIL